MKHRERDRRFVLGLDFGTLSGRAVLVDVRSGEEAGSCVQEYAHGVMEKRLPGDSCELGQDVALQHPGDYLEVLEQIVPGLLEQSGVRAEQVAGIGTDFTCCTTLPVLADGQPLCLTSQFGKQPHAWVKLWKHHAPQPEADEINDLGRQRGEAFIGAYGGKYSSEWFFSKLLETVRQAPEVYEAADRFIEAGDWLVWQLCGEERRSLSAAGFKAMRVSPADGGGNVVNRWDYPSADFFKALHPMMEGVIEAKVRAPIGALGSRAGGLTRAMAERLGLGAGTPVAVNSIDAHAAVPACSVTEPGKMVMILGTSTCHLLLGRERQEVEGMCGVVEDGVVPGYWGYEAGQAGVGDLFSWYVEHGVPEYVQKEARDREASVYEWLETEAERLWPGEHGLLALDWWNGNRSVLVDADLTGVLIGARLGTRPPEIYRALIEATAFGTRRVIEAFLAKGVEIKELYACGGLAKKSPLLMQIYSDVTGMPIRVAGSDQASALGAAMHGAVAAGIFADIQAAATEMTRLEARIYRPNPSAKDIYDRIYEQYLRLHDWFGRSERSPLKVLKQLRREVAAGGSGGGVFRG